MQHEEMYLKSPNKDIITLYIRPETDLQKMLDLLKREEPIIDNIKSRVTREGIKRSFQNLRSFLNKIPPSTKGYIICTSPTKLVYLTDVSVTIDKYYCGGEFYAAPLEEAMALRLHPIGIVTIDTQEATLGYIGTHIEVLQNLTSGIPGKHGKGGQSKERFEREREQEIMGFFRRIGAACKVFVETYKITELLISGPGLTKNRFVKGDYLDYRLRDKVTMILDTQYTGDYGIRETLHKALPSLEKNAFAKEVKVVEEFMEKLGRQFECVVYGEEQLKREMGMIKRLIKIEEVQTEYQKETFVLHFRGDHYDKIKGLGGVVGIKC